MKKILTALTLNLLLCLTATASEFDNAFKAQQKGDYDTAIKAYNKAMLEEPNNIIILNNLAGIYMYLGKIEEALSTVNKALAIDNKNAISHYLLGEIYLKKKNFKEAFNEYQTAIKLEPSFPFAYNPLSNIYLTIGDFDSAIATKKKAIELEPESPSKEILHLDLAKMYYNLDEYTQALTELELSKKLYPQSTFDYNKLTEVYLKSKDKISNEAYFKANYATFPNPEKNLLIQDKKFILQWSNFEPKEKLTQLEFVKETETVENWSEMVTILSIPKRFSLKDYIQYYLAIRKDFLLMEPSINKKDPNNIFMLIILGDKASKKAEFIVARFVQFSEDNKQAYILSRAIKEGDNMQEVLNKELIKNQSALAKLDFKLFP